MLDALESDRGMTIVRMLGDVRGRRVLDAGCGGGYFSRILADLGAESWASTRLR